MSASAKAKETVKKSTRMSGTDQVVWNMVDDQDLFCIWGIASLTEPLHDALIAKTLKYLIQTIPILNTRPVTTWFAGKWQFLEKEDIQDLIHQTQATTATQVKEQLQQTFTTPINAKNGAMIRVHTIDGPEQHYLVIQVHHLVMDGEGLKRVCAQFAEIYRVVYQDPSWTPAEQRDPCRSLSQIVRQANLINLSRLFWALPTFFSRFFVRIRPRERQKRTLEHHNYRLINNAPPDQVLSHTPSFASILLSKEVMHKAKAFTRQRTTTIHALLMASFALAAREWNRQREDQRNWLRFFYTANLRRWWGEPKGTFANFSVFLTFDEPLQNLQTPTQALKTAQTNLEQEKKIIGIDSFFIMLLLPALPYVLIRHASLFFKKRCSLLHIVIRP